MKGVLKVSTNLVLVSGLLLFSLRPSVTGRTGPEGSRASITVISVGCLHADSAPKESVHYRTSFGTCEKKNPLWPTILAFSVLDVFSTVCGVPKLYSSVVSTAAPSGSFLVLRI